MPCQLDQFSQGIQFRMAGHLGDRADQIDEGLPVGLTYPGHADTASSLYSLTR